MRDFALDLVQLPLLDVSGALRLGSRLVSTGKLRPLPGLIAVAHDRMEAACEEMGSAFGAHLQELPVGSQLWRERDRAIDSAWAAIYYLLVAWTSLPGERLEIRQAHTLSEALFPEGLKFTLLPYRLEWVESQRRVEMLQRDGFDAVIDRLGGPAFMEALLQCHELYGQVLGMSPVPAPERGQRTTLREPFWNLINAIRAYVLKISAHAADGDAATQDEAVALLLPFSEWSADHGHRDGEQTSVDGAQDIRWVIGGQTLAKLDLDPED